MYLLIPILTWEKHVTTSSCKIRNLHRLQGAGKSRWLFDISLAFRTSPAYSILRGRHSSVTIRRSFSPRNILIILELLNIPHPRAICPRRALHRGDTGILAWWKNKFLARGVFDSRRKSLLITRKSHRIRNLLNQLFNTWTCKLVLWLFLPCNCWYSFRNSWLLVPTAAAGEDVKA